MVEAPVREAATKLDEFYGDIMSCRVLVEVPHRHHRKGRQYHVRIDLTVPDAELVIKRAPRRVTDKPTRFRKAPDDIDMKESRESGRYHRCHPNAHRSLALFFQPCLDHEILRCYRHGITGHTLSNKHS